MDICMYIIANPNLGMSPGKLAAQVAHAAVEAFRLSGLFCTDEALKEWYTGGHYKKIVLQADDLYTAERYLTDRGFITSLIIDEGRTEFDGGLTPTALGVVLVDRDDEHTRATFEAFKTYREPRVAADEEPLVFEGAELREFAPLQNDKDNVGKLKRWLWAIKAS